MKRFLIITILLACIQAIDAQTTTLVLRNSKEYVGRITMQRPGIDLVFFDEKNDEEINLKWSEIASIRTSIRNSSATEGLNDELTLLSGTVLTGQIIEQSMDGTITLYLDNKQKSINVERKNILRTRKVALNSAKTLLEQRPYTNTVMTKSGSTYDGLIIEQHYGKIPSEQYLVLLTTKGYNVNINFDDVERYLYIPR